jgi:hypothetical protein
VDVADVAEEGDFTDKDYDPSGEEGDMSDEEDHPSDKDGDSSDQGNAASGEGNHPEPVWRELEELRAQLLHQVVKCKI